MPKEFLLFILTDPEQVRLLAAAVDSPWCVNYVYHTKNDKVTGIDFVVDVEDDRIVPLVEALIEK